MHNYRQQLPNLASLITFDAVARHESFTEAAAELSLTQPAVSQRIKLLEQQMGVSLFERFHKSIRLTQKGSEFHHSVVIALNHLVAASETVRVTGSQSKLRIAADIALSSCWLSPRLANLQSAFPETDIDLIATDDPDRYLEASIDIAIMHGKGSWPGCHSTLLFAEEVFPVCSPAYLDQHGPIDSIADLAQANLIDLLYEKWTWMNWTIWLSEMGAPHPGVARVFRSNLYEATISAAKEGVGIALGWRYFVDPELLHHTLVAPLPNRVKTENGYYLVAADTAVDNVLIQSVSDWIKTEFDNQQLFHQS